jgi:hypothetical protein
MDQLSRPPPIETPAERRREALMLKLQKLTLVGYDTAEIQQKLDRIVNFVLEIQSPNLFEQMMVSDILRHQVDLLARILPHRTSLELQRLPQGFFSVDIFMVEYLIEFLDRTSNIVEAEVDKVKCVLKFLICRQQPTINLSQSNLNFILELMHYFPAAKAKDILPQLLPILMSLQSPDHEFCRTLFQRIFEDSNVQNLPNLVANLVILGAARISRMKGSALAEFMVLLSNWALPESTVSNISELLMTMPKERVRFIYRVLRKLTDESSVLLFLNNISKPLKSMSQECLKFCSRGVKNLEDQSSVKLLLSKISDTLMPMSSNHLEFCSQVLKRLVDSPVSVRCFLSAIYQKTYFSANLECVSATADIFLMMDAIYNSVTENDFLVTGSTTLTMDALAKAALSLSKGALSDLSNLQLNTADSALVAARALLLAQMQFMGIVENPDLRMLKLEEFDYDADVFELPFVQELGLLNIKAYHTNAKNRIHLFNRCPELRSKLDKALIVEPGSTRITKSNQIQGSPGVGKTLATAAWCQFKALESSVGWVNIRRKSLRFAVMREGYLFVFADLKRQPLKDPISFISEQNFCAITAVDGVSKHQGADLMDAACDWSEKKPSIRQAIGICSLQYTDKSLPTYIMPPWKLEEYLKASINDDIWNQFKYIFLECAAFVKEFTERCEKDYATVAVSLNSGDLKLRESIIIWKYFYAGISSRFMFELTVEDITNLVETSLTTLQSMEHVGFRSEIAVNTLSYEKDGSGGHAFSSDFILEKYGERVDKFNDAMDQILKRAIPAARGQYFEYTYLKISKRKETYKIKVTRHINGNEAGRIIPLESEGYLEFSAVEPPWYELSNEVKIEVLDLTDLPSFVSYDDFARRCLGVRRKVTSWIDINPKIDFASKRKRPITSKERKKFHEKMGNSYQLDKNNFVRYMDLKQAKNIWLLPKSLQEPAIDAIYVVSPKEVWLVQFTVADRHSINEEALIRAKYLLQDMFGANVGLWFVFIIPTGQKKIAFPEDILRKHHIKFLVGETVKSK